MTEVENDPVLQQMLSYLAVWEAQADARAIFLNCYAMMTRNMLAELERGGFEDNNWVRALLGRFAEYYFVALYHSEHSGEALPAVWRTAFEAARQSRANVIQNLVLGVNAHINYDLVFALADMLNSDWRSLSQERRQSRYRDHCHVNDIISQTVNIVQDQVIERRLAGFDLVDKLMGPLDELLTSRLIASWREEVWQNAIALVEIKEELERQTLIDYIEQRSVKRAHVILGAQGLGGYLNLV
jgi:hypothetical protein